MGCTWRPTRHNIWEQASDTGQERGDTYDGVDI